MAFSKLTVTLFKAGFGSSSSTLFSTYNGEPEKKKSKHRLLFFSQSMKQKQNNQKLLHTNSFVFFDHQTLSFRQCFTGKIKPLQHNTQKIYITEDLVHDSPPSFFLASLRVSYFILTPRTSCFVFFNFLSDVKYAGGGLVLLIT